MMTWMLWAVTVAALLGASAHLAEWALRDRRREGRWVWLVALLASAGLPLWRWLRPASPPDVSATGGAAGWTVVDASWLVDMGSTAAARAPWSTDLLDAVLIGGWGVSALVATAALLGGLHSLSRRARVWERVRVEEDDVLVSDDFGPALVGIGKPRIVLPEWALRLPAEELRMAYLHEAEHRDAGDARVLFLGALVVSLMPWNVPLWWHLRRLRLAVEVDCDARVLGRGASPRAYGRMLLELGAAESRNALPVLALAKPESLLERRMKMIVRNVRTRGPLRAVAASALSAVLLVVACDAPPPTNLEGGDASADLTATEAPESGAAGTITPSVRERGDLGSILEGASGRFFFEEASFFVDDQRVDGVPEDLDASRIERVEVQKGEGGEASRVSIFTLRETADPLVYVDGELFQGDLSEIGPEDIERVEVLKGESALERYGESGANGVIRITTKGIAGTVSRR